MGKSELIEKNNTADAAASRPPEPARSKQQQQQTSILPLSHGTGACPVFVRSAPANVKFMHSLLSLALCGSMKSPPARTVQSTTASPRIVSVV